MLQADVFHASRSKLAALALLTLVAGCGPGGNTVCTTADGVAAAPVPLDIYLMLSQSGSMADIVSGSTSRWDAVVLGLGQFASQPNLQSVALGIQYFGLPVPGNGPIPCMINADCATSALGAGFCFGSNGATPGICLGGITGDSCIAADYATPASEIAALPASAPALITSLDAHSPGGSSATSAALQGAIDHAKVWAAAHASHDTVALLIQNGAPTECNTSQANLNTIAAQGSSGASGIPTYVMNVGAANAGLDAIAAAGGTTSAYQPVMGSGAAASVFTMLNQIEKDARGCRYQLPVSTQGPLDTSLVSVTYTPTVGGTRHTLEHLADKTACTGVTGWYFDNDANPTEIDFCPNTAMCGAASGANTGAVTIFSGCTLQ